MGASQWGVSPIYLALVLSISWAMGNALCPASANVVAVSDMVGQSPIKVSLRWNGPYVLVATAVLVLVLTMARMGGLSAAIAIAPSWKCIETADQRLDIGGFGRGLPLTYKCPYDFKVRY